MSGGLQLPELLAGTSDLPVSVCVVICCTTLVKTFLAVYLSESVSCFHGIVLIPADLAGPPRPAESLTVLTSESLSRLQSVET